MSVVLPEAFSEKPKNIRGAIEGMVLFGCEMGSNRISHPTLHCNYNVWLALRDSVGYVSNLKFYGVLGNHFTFEIRYIFIVRLSL